MKDYSEYKSPACGRWAELISRLRTEFDESQSVFAKRFGVSFQSVQQWESQGVDPKFKSKVVVANMMGWDVQALEQYLQTGIEPGGDEPGAVNIYYLEQQFRKTPKSVLRDVICLAADYLEKDRFDKDRVNEVVNGC